MSDINGLILLVDKTLRKVEYAFTRIALVLKKKKKLGLIPFLINKFIELREEFMELRVRLRLTRNSLWQMDYRIGAKREDRKQQNSGAVERSASNGRVSVPKKKRKRPRQKLDVKRELAAIMRIRDSVRATVAQLEREVETKEGSKQRTADSIQEAEAQNTKTIAQLDGSPLDALERRPAQSQIIPAISEGARKVALARINLLKAWDEFRAGRNDKLSVMDRKFVEAYNCQMIHKGLFATLGNVNLRTLYRWKSKAGDPPDYYNLVPGWYGKKTNRMLSSDEKSVFMGLLLHPNQISIGTAVRLTKFYLERKGIESISSEATFRRYAEDFKANHYDIWVLMREGQKALRDKVGMYIKRDVSKLDVGDVLVADGHRLNFQVINPFTGKPARATLVGFVDWKSWELAGYEIMMEENVQCIASALRNAIIRLGKTPKVVYVDNGKAFRARFFSSHESIEDMGVCGAFARLGISLVFAKPYNARSKIIERWFKEFSNTCERLLPSYVGSSVENKPAWMRMDERFHRALHNEYVPTIREAIRLIEEWQEFHRSQPCPHEKSKTIGEVFDSGRGEGVDAATLDELMMDVKPARVGRNGIRFLGANYYNDSLYGLHEPVILKYSLFDLSSIKVFTRDGQFLCEAKRGEEVHPIAQHLGTPQDMEQFKRAIAQQKRLERQTVEVGRQLARWGKTPKLDWQKVSTVVPRVIDKLEAEQVALPPTEVQIPEGAYLGCSRQHAIDSVQADLPADEPKRPTFRDPLERYMWHMDNLDSITDEDRAWIEEFKKSESYRLYKPTEEFFEKQKRGFADEEGIRND